MQTFLLKLGCLFLFGFIFFSAYQANNNNSNFLSKSKTVEQLDPIPVLVSNAVESNQKTIEIKQPSKPATAVPSTSVEKFN